MTSGRYWISTAWMLIAAYFFTPAIQAEDFVELAKKALNPVAAINSLPAQYNWDQKRGPTGHGFRSVTNIQPVLPFALNEDWNLISPTIYRPTWTSAKWVSGQSDVGDVTQGFFFSS